MYLLHVSEVISMYILDKNHFCRKLSNSLEMIKSSESCSLLTTNFMNFVDTENSILVRI